MAVSAYVLIQTEVGKAAQVASEVASIDGVISAEDVTGPYDVIARAEADTVDELPDIVAFYETFGDRVPAELRDELRELEARLSG